MRRLAWALSLWTMLGAAAVTVEIKGKVTNEFSEEQYRGVSVRITDRLGTEIGRTQANSRGQFQIKISSPRYIIIEATLQGFPTLRYQLDTEEQKESTTDFEHNRVFGELRNPTYYQNITFRAAADQPLSLEDLLANEDPQAVKAYRAARRQKEAGELDKAVDSLENLIKKYPNFYIGFIDAGMILVVQQKNDRAIEVFRQARRLRPEHSWAYVGLGLAFNNKREYRTAQGYAERAVELEPDSVNAQFQLGQASFHVGHYDQALRCFQRVIELAPKFNAMTYKYMSSIQVKKLDREGAARSLQSYLAQFPDAADRDKVEQILKKLGR